MTDDSRHAISLVAPPDDVDAVHALLEGIWTESPWVAAIDRASFETALIELVSNVIRHSAGERVVRCELTVSLAAGRLEASLSDTGDPVEVDLEWRSMPDELSEGGRGIPMIRALVDNLEYRRAGSHNYWTISRTLVEPKSQ